jgi:hypothetical protein
MWEIVDEVRIYHLVEAYQLQLRFTATGQDFC